MATEVWQWVFEEEGEAADLNSMIDQIPKTCLVAVTPDRKEKSSVATAYPGTADITLKLYPCVAQVLAIRFLWKCATATASIEARVTLNGVEVAQTSTGGTSGAYTTGLLELPMASLTTHGDVTGQDVTVSIYLKTSSASFPVYVKAFVVTACQTTTHTIEL